MAPMPIVDLLARGRQLAERGERVSVLWQEPESLAFVARGREYRSEFHINPSDEVMLMIKGDMRLHFRTPEGKEEGAVVAEGSTIYTPAGTPHSPRFPPDAYLLVIERQRRPGEIDRFRWFCPRCDALLHEEGRDPRLSRRSGVEGLCAFLRQRGVAHLQGLRPRHAAAVSETDDPVGWVECLPVTALTPLPAPGDERPGSLVEIIEYDLGDQLGCGDRACDRHVARYDEADDERVQ